MAIKWTEEQQEVISLRNANILVSAAAGSGKTAVLVQRIIDKLMDRDHPVNIDQMVIVTFTNAAAAEMRMRIQDAIEQEAARYPDDAHLQRQRTRIHMSNICTIHRLCKTIIQNHFQEIDVEPSFRIGDEGELELMKKDALAEVLEEYYSEDSPEFACFVETFASGKDDQEIEEAVLELYRFSMAYPDPQRWLSSCVHAYETADCEELGKTGWMRALMQHIGRMSAFFQEKLAAVRMLLEAVPEGENYREIFEYYQTVADTLQTNRDYDQLRDCIRNVVHPALPRGKKSCQDPAVREQIKAARDDIKTVLTKWADDYFVQSSEEILEDLANCRPVIQTLVRVTKRFLAVFGDKKRQSNVLDFHDLEQEALRILIQEDGTVTQTAKEYADYFDEILIDEYQDSSLIQEYLLTSLSKRYKGENNLFMVGDAKQSIYRFRLARPELFLEKFNTYTRSSKDCRRIDLHKNFRSRTEVLSSANYIFERIMQQTLGGIAYDETVALYPGMEFPASNAEGEDTTELLIFDKQDRELIPDAVFYESKLIAGRIRQLVDERDGMSVLDRRTGTYRRARYGDIAILLRSQNGYDTALLKALAQEGIPAHTISKEGYFHTLEITTILNYLRVIDNPYQDIPLLTVLKSPIAGFCDEELALLRIEQGEGLIYSCLLTYAAQGEHTAFKHKLSNFLEQLKQFRERMYYTPIHKFICYILDVTGYGNYIRAMQGGEQRAANVQMLIERAAAFEETSYLGVFQFVRYMEQLQKYQMDSGEAQTANEHDNTVRIMTIHKSKGLEFPIVFVAGLGRGFNRMEARNKLVLHPDYGIGMDNVLLETRQKNKMLLRKTILLQNQLDTLGEELRILYVALTRAKEKLILTGSTENLKKKLARAAEQGRPPVVSYADLTMADSFMEWILAALGRHPAMCGLYDRYLEDAGVQLYREAADSAGFIIREVRPEELVEEELTEYAKQAKEQLWFDLEKERACAGLPENLRQALEYEYPYFSESGIPTKVSVSELKQAAEDMEAAARYRNPEEPETVKVVPDFMGEARELSAVSRGTAYHKIFECLDLTRAETVDMVAEQMRQLCEKGVLDEPMRTCLNPQKIVQFVQSGLGQRMKAAQKRQCLYREQPFVYSMPACRLDKTYQSEEPVMVQGVMDAFFEEDGEWVLLDYKTDLVRNGEEQMLVERYQEQLRYYQCALEDITRKKVKELVLYSVSLGKTVPVPTEEV